MQYRIFTILISIICLSGYAFTSYAQDTNDSDNASKPVILYSGTPKKYEIASIKVEGVKNYEDYVLIGLSGLTVGQSISIPGDDITQACRRYWRHVGVLATPGTIKSESYPMEIHKLYPDIQVTGNACPLWVPIVESNEAGNEGADYFVRKYISELLSKDNQIDTVILGCTHYPLLLPKIQQYMPAGIRIVAQGELVAQSLKNYLMRHPEIASQCTQGNSCSYCTTESEEKFIESASAFLSENINVQHITLE